MSDVFPINQSDPYILLRLSKLAQPRSLALHFNLGNFDDNKPAKHKEVKGKNCLLENSTMLFPSYYTGGIVL